METAMQSLINECSIKKLKFHKGHDGQGFNCDLYYKGKLVSSVYDGAYGGEFEYTTFDVELMKQLEREYNKIKEKDFYCIDSIVDKLINAHQLEKDKKKGVVLKRDWGYDIRGYKVSIPTLLKKYKDGLDAVQKIVDEETKKGEEILNKDYLQTIGVVFN